VTPDEGLEPLDDGPLPGRLPCFVGDSLEAIRSAPDDRPQDILFRGDVGIQAGTPDVQSAGDVANARSRIALFPK